MEVINTIGRRKTSVARIYLSAGKGQVTVNGKDIKEYFPTEVHQNIVKYPLEVAEEIGKVDLKVNVNGGGFKGQAEATRMAIARALCEVNPDYRPALKKEGLLTRDPRMVERKKYGRAKARKKFQFSKR